MSVIFLCLTTIGFLIVSKDVKEKQPTDAVNKFGHIVDKVSAPSTNLENSSLTVASSSQKLTEKRLTVNFIAGDASYSISVIRDSSIYDAMMTLSASSIKPFIFEAENYPGLGYFIKSINGVKNSDGYYWTLYINDKYATAGASSYKLSDGDKIEWRYEKN